MLIGLIISIVLAFTTLNLIKFFAFIFGALFFIIIIGAIVGVWLVATSALWDLANDSSKGPGKNLLGLILALLFSGLFGIIILFIIKYLFIQLPCRKYNTLNVKEENAEIT